MTGLKNLFLAAVCGGAAWLLYGQAGYPQPGWVAVTVAGAMLLGTVCRPSRSDADDRRPVQPYLCSSHHALDEALRVAEQKSPIDDGGTDE